MGLNKQLNNLNSYPFHMPGHKRNNKFGIVGADIDITEIEGFDNLHSPSSVLLDIENSLSKIYLSAKSFMLVNGSTVGILSAIFAVCNSGDKIIISRNCHKSVYNACMLLKLNVVYAEPEFDCIDGYYVRNLQIDVDKVILDNPDAKALVITSPTYEGNVSNITVDIPLIIDAAHGAHFGLGYFPAYPSADIVVSSLHKTLPALTQTAVLNVYNTKYIDKCKMYLDMFETSSPSYVLMASVEKCVQYMLNNNDDFVAFYNDMCDFRDINLHALRLKYSDDVSKIVISTSGCDITGAQLANILRTKYAIEVEMASATYVILMATVADTSANFANLKKALLEIDSTLLQSGMVSYRKPPIPQGTQKIFVGDKSLAVKLDNAVNKISNEFVYAYPPDIPILAPGEVITSQTVDYIKQVINKGVNIISDSGLLPNQLLTNAE